jgi:hypothetical protein
MSRREREALDQHITGNYGETNEEILLIKFHEWLVNKGLATQGYNPYELVEKFFDRGKP